MSADENVVIPDALLVETLTRLFTQTCSHEVIQQAESDGWAPAVWEPLAATGAPWVGVAEAAGGSGGTLADAVAVQRLVGRFAVPLPVAETGLLGGWLAGAAGITLPDGLCATVFADGLVGARHLSVAPDGTVYVAIADAPGGDPDGGVVALRDDDGDGHAEHIERFGERGGNGVTVHDGWLYLARNDSVVRYRLPAGDSVGLTPDGDPETIVSGLPDSPDHFAKTAVIDDEGRMFVNIGSPSNACQVDNREPFSPGIDPCPELEDRAGIWRFDADEQGQTQADGTRYATGVRNANALAIDPDTGRLYAAINGRDQLFENWPDRYDEADDLTKPAEEVHAIVEGGDYGWPYCYFDPQQGRHVLAPEYGGDGREAGRCDDVPEPAVTFPAHWAPLGMTFPTVDALGERYRDGAFIAFHGSRFDPANQPEGPGYVVAFVPFEDGMATGEWEVFADGFAGDSTDLPAEAEHRAVDVAEGPDGALYLSDDVGGRIWRVSPESR
ncbi:MAG: PQQ-dependent sugar dehydrogenase [Nocardioidaceae bacterium]|nr:PQQ-dependent sugar dehydrogenase [Nocardioidaceae bacterium]